MASIATAKACSETAEAKDLSPGIALGTIAESTAGSPTELPTRGGVG